MRGLILTIIVCLALICAAACVDIERITTVSLVCVVDNDTIMLPINDSTYQDVTCADWDDSLSVVIPPSTP